ncbi:transcriptional regulator [Janthinobacterium sp. CG_23.3]|uniref:transcriptional regulator n=1 Tax=Janthinobacterium sp. CG_23.3 TaxID=3349634 RepID=UPI0038D427E4
MKPHYIVLAALAAISLFALAKDEPGKLAAPWLLAGETPKQYQIGVDYTETSSGKGAKFLRHADGDGESWATLMQAVSAENYRGQRLRFRARVKTREVGDWAGLWMRVDRPGEHSAAFYNSEDQPIKGSVDWQWRSVVLDVAADAKALSFGVTEAGKGQVWIDELTLEAVGRDVPLDVQRRVKALPAAPVL